MLNFPIKILPKKIKNFLYYKEYKSYSYENAEKYFLNKASFSAPIGCSSFCNADFHARNLDWYYDNEAEFVIKVPSSLTRYGSIGVAGADPQLTKDVVDSHKWVKNYEYLPFRMLDGINDQGLICNINVVPAGDMGETISTNPAGEKKVCAATLIRYFLDSCKNVSEVIDLVNSLDIYSLPGYEVHFMVSDTDTVIAIEFVDNQVVIITNQDEDGYLDFPDNSKPVMTNFYLSKRTNGGIAGLDPTKIRAIEETALTQADTDLTAHAQGVERYNLLVDHFADVDSDASAMATIKLAQCTKSYKTDTSPFWFTEYVGSRTIYQAQEDYEDVIELYTGIIFPNATRANPAIWHTTHTSVYNRANGTLTLCSQEMDAEDYAKEYIYTLEMKQEEN